LPGGNLLHAEFALPFVYLLAAGMAASIVFDLRG
jgi:hypothetical protein